MNAVTTKRRGRTSFADPSFAGTTSLAALPESGPAAPSSAMVGELVHNPHNPREDYWGESISELGASLAETGQLQPITVVSRDVFLAHHPEDEKALGAARWVVLTGNRRLAAARNVGLERLSIVVADHLGGSDPRLSEATLIENLHREALPPLLEARELQALVDRHGSQVEVAKRVSKTPSWVNQRLSLLRLLPGLQNELQSGHLTVAEARQIATAPPAKQERRLAELQGLTPATAEPSDEHQPSPRRRGRPRKSVDVEDTARQLRARLTADEVRRLVELLTAPDGD